MLLDQRLGFFPSLHQLYSGNIKGLNFKPFLGGNLKALKVLGISVLALTITNCAPSAKQLKEAVEKGTDIISLKRLVAEVDQRKRVKDTNVGQTLLSEIADLEVLFEHYEEF